MWGQLQWCVRVGGCLCSRVCSPMQAGCGRIDRRLSEHVADVPERHGDLHPLPFRSLPRTGIQKRVVLCRGASYFFGFDKRGGGVGRRVSTLVCPEVFWFESSEPLQLSSRAKGFFSTPATRDHQHDASADTNFLESCVGGPLREMPLWTGTFRSTCLAGKP